MDQVYRKIVEHILGNWTALKLAVEHGMGGPNSKQIAIDIIDYLVNYITTENNIEVEDIEDVLENIMDQDFSTICEDNSIKEISHLMFRFLQLLKEGKTEQCEAEYNSLPIGTQWLQSVEKPQPEITEVEQVIPSTTGTTDAAMEEGEEEEADPDPGWTKVKSKRNR